MKVRILRQQSSTTEPYWEVFDYNGSEDNSVAGVLDHINYHDDVTDIDGRKSTRIGWECSCMQGVCGACAMIINGVPALACDTLIRDLKKKELEIRPLRKFPVVHDLIVDRSSIFENLEETDIYISEYKPAANGDHHHQYTVAKCLKCGLCLEVCPNYTDGRSFFGAAFANDCYLVAARNREKAGEIRAAYKAHFGGDCSKSLSCMTVCPIKIQTIASMARLNKGKQPI